MEPRGASDIDGQTERSIWVGAHESKCGQRNEFQLTWPTVPAATRMIVA